MCSRMHVRARMKHGATNCGPGWALLYFQDVGRIAGFEGRHTVRRKSGVINFQISIEYMTYMQHHPLCPLMFV